MKKKIAVIGSGVSGLSASAYLAAQGHQVHVFEKHSGPGGRARQFKTVNGYTFDMGPSWYWMPDIIDGFFQDFGCKATDFYTLMPLSPQFEIIFGDGAIAVPDTMDKLRTLVESLEPGAGRQLDRFMDSARNKYQVGMRDFVEKPCHSWLEFLSPKIAASALSLDLLSDFRTYVGRYFANPKLRTLMEFPVIFLGASPKKIPALYSLMNYGGYALGTWYPMGGFHELVKAMQRVAQAQGARFHFESEVKRIIARRDRVTSLVVDGDTLDFDAVVSAADYHHTETLLDEGYRNYKERYWQSRTFAPSCLIYFLGFNERIPGLHHHTLFFEHELDHHIKSIYEDRAWPEKPLFYACCPSKTDPGVAPENHENVFLLMPLAIGVDDRESTRERYLQDMLHRLEKHTGTTGLASKIDYKRSYCVSDFVQDYHAYGGNAYGLANTLSQTAVRKPSIRNKRLRNLYYTGQLTVPGPGVPPAIISGRIVAGEIDHLKSKYHEKAV